MPRHLTRNTGLELVSMVYIGLHVCSPNRNSKRVVHESEGTGAISFLVYPFTSAELDATNGNVYIPALN